MEQTCYAGLHLVGGWCVVGIVCYEMRCVRSGVLLTVAGHPQLHVPELPNEV